eukprot:6484193-Amphidinium_carterae.1
MFIDNVIDDDDADDDDDDDAEEEEEEEDVSIVLHAEGETAISRKTRLEFATIGYTLSWFVGRPEVRLVLTRMHEFQNICQPL